MFVSRCSMYQAMVTDYDEKIYHSRNITEEGMEDQSISSPVLTGFFFLPCIPAGPSVGGRIAHIHSKSNP